MVILIQYLFVFLSLTASLTLSAQEVKITADVDQQSLSPGVPAKGLLTVIHPTNQSVDSASAKLAGKTLAIDLQTEVPLSAGSGGLMSIYSFALEAQEAGLHELPEIEIKVGGKAYRSIATTYTVEERGGRGVSTPSTPTSPRSTPSVRNTPPPAKKGVPQLRLEAAAVGPQTLFPGQRVQFVYKYFYSGDIELASESLPLLSTTDFVKISDRTVRDYAQGGVSVREISQEMEAQKPGDYNIGPSVIEGYAYQVDLLGRKVYNRDKLRAEAPPVHLTVKEFPTAGKPTSFNGALGQNMTFETKLISKATVNVGDPVEISIAIGSKSDLKNVGLPELCCQPGFPGMLRLGDLPPVGKISGNVKTFVVTFRPLTDLVKEIPSIEFSYFDPTSQKYVVLNSKALPLTVQKLKTPPPENLDAQTPATAKEPTPSIEPQAIEIGGNYKLMIRDLRPLVMGSWLALLIVPLGAGLLLLEVFIYREMQRRRLMVKVKTSSELFQEAMASREDPPSFIRLLSDSLFKLLHEKGETLTIVKSSDDLPEGEDANKVREFLEEIESQRFTGREVVVDDPLIQRAKQLFTDLGGG